MRKIIQAVLAASVALPALAVPVMASAQSYGEVRQDRHEVRKDHREIRQDVRRGDYREARADRHDLHRDNRELREDWRDYRRAHRDTYRRAAYRGPRGYVYRPVPVGYRFAPAYYGSRYWVPDYARYRLPAPGHNHRWVRYGNDVLLINLRTGAVLRSYNGFFW